MFENEEVCETCIHDRYGCNKYTGMTPGWDDKGNGIIVACDGYLKDTPEEEKAAQEYMRRLHNEHNICPNCGEEYTGHHRVCDECWKKKRKTHMLAMAKVHREKFSHVEIDKEVRPILNRLAKKEGMTIPEYLKKLILEALK